MREVAAAGLATASRLAISSSSGPVGARSHAVANSEQRKISGRTGRQIMEPEYKPDLETSNAPVYGPLYVYIIWKCHDLVRTSAGPGGRMKKKVVVSLYRD